MSTRTSAPAIRSGLEQAANRREAAYLSINLLALAAIAVVAVVAIRGRPAPGGHGDALGVSIALIAFGAAMIGAMMLTRCSPSAVQLPVLLVAVSGAAALVGLQPHGAGFLGVFPAVSLAAMVLPVRLSLAVLGFALPAVAVAYLAGGHAPVVGVVLNEFGVAAFYLLSLLARRLRESNRQAEELLAELEQTRAAQAQSAALAERQRLAREVHDVLAHSLSGLVLNLEGARLLAGQGGVPGQLGDTIERAHRLAKTGLEEAKQAIGMLRGDALPGPERLAELAAGFESDSGVSCTVAVSGQPRDLSTEARLTLYRVAQEALTNVRKHAQAGRVDITLAYEPAGTRLKIQDFDSDGPPAPKCDGSGYGLTGMAERAELLGGMLAAGPAGNGFLVELWVPA